MRTPRFAYSVPWTLVLLFVGSPICAQDGSPVTELIAEARTALDDLEYESAESIARSLLALGSDVGLTERLEAYKLLAAAFFPEELHAQRPDSAVFYLRALIRAAPDAELPREMSWPGLDSLFVLARLTTFATRATVVSDTLEFGVQAETVVTGTASHPAYFALVAESVQDSGRVLLDSVGPTTHTVLAVRALTADQPTLRSGEYNLRVTVVQAQTGERVDHSYAAQVVAPPFGLRDVPNLDSTLLLAERTTPHRARNTLIGLGLGATTALLATTFRASEPVNQVRTDSRAYLAAGGIALGAVLGAFVERARPIPSNIAHNERVHADHAERVAAVDAENARLRAAYRTTILITGEVP